MTDLGITRLQPGSLFAGDYRVLSPLSQGGMGAVFVAEQQSTGKQRALKVMLPQLVADPGLRRRFEQEARVGSQIASEHVVEVVGAGVDAATGMPWLAMELLRGEDLAHVVARRGPLPPLEVLAIFEQLCHALGAAHAAGVIHRDLKPENLFLGESRRAGAAFTLKVLDFGIAKITQEAQTGSTSAMGSPMWMAPEQTERSPVTPATDIWALGLVAFYLLTGARFWKAAQNDDTTVMQLMREILFEPIPPATARAAELGARLPVSLDGWFARCLARSPAARFPNASAAFVELRACLTDPARRTTGAVAAAPVEVRPRVATVVQTAPGWAPPAGAAPPLAPTQGMSNGPAAAYTPPPVQSPTYPGPQNRGTKGGGLAVLLVIAGVCVAGTLGLGVWLVERDGDPSSETALTAPPGVPGAPSIAPAPAPPASAATPQADDVPLLGDAGLGLLGTPRGTAAPAVADHPRAAAAPNVHVGKWSCLETDDATFTSPLGTPPYHNQGQGTASVVENADHTITTTYFNGEDTCAWRERVSGATALAFPQQSCHTKDGGVVTLASAVRNVSGGTATSHSTTFFRRYIWRFGQRVELVGTNNATVQCTRQ